MTTLTMKIKKAVNTEKQSDFIYLSMTELNTLVNMQRVKAIRVSTEYNPTSDIKSNMIYDRTSSIGINKKQAKELVKDRLEFADLKGEEHYQRVYISKWRNNTLYISI